MNKLAETSVALDGNIANRWSTRSFNPTYEISDSEVIALLEAARWAASGSNTQPWRFVVAKRGSNTFKRIAETLSGNNKIWAPNASLFIVACAQTHSSEGKERKLALYDVGLAVGQLGIQATSLGLHIHQMAGFDSEALTSSISIPSDLKALVVIAVGKYSDNASLPDDLLEREKVARSRKSLEEIVVEGLPNL